MAPRSNLLGGFREVLGILTPKGAASAGDTGDTGDGEDRVTVLGVTVAHPGEMLERSRTASGELLLLLDF